MLLTLGGASHLASPPTVVLTILKQVVPSRPGKARSIAKHRVFVSLYSIRDWKTTIRPHWPYLIKISDWMELSIRKNQRHQGKRSTRPRASSNTLGRSMRSKQPILGGYVAGVANPSLVARILRKPQWMEGVSAGSELTAGGWCRRLVR